MWTPSREWTGSNTHESNTTDAIETAEEDMLFPVVAADPQRTHA